MAHSMPHRSSPLTAALLLVGLLTAASAAPTTQEAAVLFRKPLPGGREIAIVRGPDLDATIMRGLWPDAAVNAFPIIFEIKAELRSPNAPTLQLWTAQFVDEKKNSPVVVLDVHVEPGELLMAFGTTDIVVVQ